VPYGVSEVDIAGGLRGEPLEMIKCETIDLEVPATSEIVIEGEIRPDDLLTEGPFGEYTGYMAGAVEPRPVIRVKAVTYRNNPIFTMSNMGMPVDDSHVMSTISTAAEVRELLKGRGLPVTDVSVFSETCYLLAVVAVKVPYANVASDIAHVVWASRYGVALPYVIVVEDDVDPFSISEVFHAVVTKCHPSRGINVLEHTTAGVLIPWLNRHERKHHIGARVYFDCTWPLDWDPADVPKKASFARIYPEKVQQRALAVWRKYGY
ncbi:MAG: UbiD family decarboxylase, partial [Chloroflexi bacterium]|nr:UbiD family decarboxylase [Chloroflexota bacterium]